MRTYEEWMNEYSESHRHPVNKKIHHICVPLIMFSLLGMLAALPTPNILDDLHWGHVLLGLSLIFYFTLNLKMALGMIVQGAIMLLGVHYLALAQILLPASISIFVLAWIGQFYGHKIEGKKPSFLKDLLFLLIGPLWVQRDLFKKLGINV